MGFRPVLEVTRGDVVESLHHGAVAVADPDGRVIASLGDPEAVTYLRSSAKPFQALPLIESGAADHMGLTLEEIAITCASHSGTDAHVEVVASLLARAGLSEELLQCGTHRPYDQATARRLKQSGLAPTSIRHNCSGKHSAMLALARYLEAPLETYLDPTHPVQTRILTTVGEMCGLREDQIHVGIDGCSAPNFAVPLRSAATAFARLAGPSSLDEPRSAACQRVFKAMTTHPEMVGGPGKFDTRLMQVVGGRILSKGGAEGYFAFALPPDTLGVGQPACGVAVKIADGNLGRRAGSPVALEVLRQLNALGYGDLEALREFGPVPVTNHRGAVVGTLRTCFHLERSG